MRILLLLLFIQVSVYAKYNQNQLDLAFELPVNLQKENKLEEAVIYYNDFIELYPESKRVSKALWSIAKIQEERQEYSKSLKTLNKIFLKFGQSSDGIKALFESARLYEFQGLNQKAIETYKEVINSNNNPMLVMKAKERIKLFEIMKD